MSNKEYELLKEQNELLKEQLKNNKSNINIVLIVIIIVLVIAVGVCIYLLANDNSSNNSSNNNSNYDDTPRTTESEKQCVKWKTTWNYSYCETAYTTPSYCHETGQECVEWK
jgi:hypothetical protein